MRVRCQFNSDQYCEPYKDCALFVIGLAHDKRKGHGEGPTGAILKCATLISIAEQMREKVEEDYNSWNHI